MSGGPSSGGGGEPLSAAELAVRAAIACILLLLAQVFTGLNLGLFGLDCGQLQVIIDVPQKSQVSAKALEESKFARRVLPLRRLGNLLLCTILLGNTMVNAAMALVLSSVTGGFFGWLSTTLIIVYIGEILPQSVCARHGLRLGALGSPIIWLFVVLLFPVTKLYAIVLDYLFPDEESLMDRREWQDMVEYIKVCKPGSMTADQSTMLLGALDLGVTCVRDVMVPIKEACFLEADDELNFDKLMWIQQTGFTRLPVYDKSIDKCIGLLHCKDLLRRDLGMDIHKSNTLSAAALLKALRRKGQHREVCQIPESTSLLEVLSLFKQGKPHLLVVYAEEKEGAMKPEDLMKSKDVGVVTLHDVHQFIWAREETEDITKVQSQDVRRKGAIGLFEQSTGNGGILALRARAMSSGSGSNKGGGAMETQISVTSRDGTPTALDGADPQLQAIKVLLQQTQPCFDPMHVSDAALWDILKDSEVIVVTKGEQLYRSHEHSHIATVVLSGQIEVLAGRDGFVSWVDHLATLGMPALDPPQSLLQTLRASRRANFLQQHDVHDYMPDFTATVVSNECRVLRIYRETYLKGYASTQLTK